MKNEYRDLFSKLDTITKASSQHTKYLMFAPTSIRQWLYRAKYSVTSNGQVGIQPGDFACQLEEMINKSILFNYIPSESEMIEGFITDLKISGVISEIIKDEFNGFLGNLPLDPTAVEFGDKESQEYLGINNLITSIYPYYLVSIFSFDQTKLNSADTNEVLPTVIATNGFINLYSSGELSIDYNGKAHYLAKLDLQTSHNKINSDAGKLMKALIEWKKLIGDASCFSLKELANRSHLSQNEVYNAVDTVKRAINRYPLPGKQQILISLQRKNGGIQFYNIVEHPEFLRHLNEKLQ